MENQRTFLVMLVMATQCCLGVLSSPGQLTDSCVLQKYQEETQKGFAIATEGAFNFVETKMTERSEGNKKVCQYNSYELMRVKDIMIGGNKRGLYSVLDALASKEPSPTDGISRNIIKSAVTEVVDGFIETWMEILNAYCKDQYSKNNSQILDNIKKRRDTVPSGSTTVVKSLFMTRRNYQALQPGMEIVFNNTETKAIAICTRALDQIYVGSLMMFKTFFGSDSDSEDCFCTLYEALKISLKSFASETNTLYELVRFYASIISEKRDSLVDVFSVIQMSQDLMLNRVQAGLKTQFDAMDLKLKLIYGILNNNTGCESCKFDMAEEKTKSYFKAALEAFLHVVSLISRETESTAMATRFSVYDSMNKVCSSIFDVLRFSKSTSDSKVQNVYNFNRNLSLSQIKNLHEILGMAIKNGQTYPDYMQALLNKYKISAATGIQSGMIHVYHGLEIVMDAVQGSGNGYNDSQALIDRCHMDAYLELEAQCECLFNELRLIAVYTSTEDRPSVMNISQIQMTEQPTYSNISTGIDIIFNEILTALNNINSGNYSSSNHSMAASTDAFHKTVNELIKAADITLTLFSTMNSGASWTVEPTRKEMTVLLRESIEAIFEACQLVQCQNCEGLQAKIEELEKQATSNYTTAIGIIFKVIMHEQMNGTRVNVIIEQYMKKALEKCQYSYKNVFDAIRILAGQIFPESRIASNTSVILVNNIRSTCKTNVEDRVSLTCQAMQFRIASNLIGPRISDGFSVIETQRQKAHAGFNDGFNAFYDAIHSNTCSPNCSETATIDRTENMTHMSFKIMSESAFSLMKTVLFGTSSTVATVQGSTYAALRTMVSSMFSIIRSIYRNERSEILAEIDIMQAMAVCSAQAVIKSWYVPFTGISYHQDNAEMRNDLNNTIFTSLNICENVFATTFNEIRHYLSMISPDTCSESACNSITIEDQKTTTKHQFKPVIDSVFDNILMTFVTQNVKVLPGKMIIIDTMNVITDD
ncbi:uncharacterized protein LOC124406511 [Diprion similis]|uniref:uncharacterized protein LOC124406511 n=1 Tax=Diprion similis TaxID=362088 RepID=UPI001EF77C2A|nr:uncharacterized protein LOC124406511 [Diprion similis]